MSVYGNSIFTGTSELMNALTSFLSSRVKFVTQKIENFNEVEDIFIINATGLGSRKLNQDPEMVSIQGHLLMLKDQKFQELQYMMLESFLDSMSV